MDTIILVEAASRTDQEAPGLVLREGLDIKGAQTLFVGIGLEPGELGIRPMRCQERGGDDHGRNSEQASDPMPHFRTPVSLYPLSQIIAPARSHLVAIVR